MIATRRSALALAFAAALAAPALAAGMQPFGTANFEAAREKGPVVVHIDATWCPTCRAQKPILAKLLADKRFAAFKAFQVDYDTEKKAMREMKVSDRSTIIVFKGGKEIARGTGETTEPPIEALLAKAL